MKNNRGAVQIGIGALIVIGLIVWIISSSSQTASIKQQEIIPSASPTLERCVYSSGTSITGNATLRTDTAVTNNVYVDIDESAWLLDSNGQAPAEVNLSFTCTRAGSTAKSGAVKIVAKSNPYISETDTSSASSYNIIQTGSTPSEIWSGRYVQTLYVEDDAQATTSSTKEETYLTFSEGEKELDVYVMAEIDATSFENLNNYTTKAITLYERRESGSDKQLGTITIQKIP